MPMISVLIPASNEAALIGGCLTALCASDWPGSRVEVIVIANGCTDDTTKLARGFAPRFAARDWSLVVLDRAEGGKLAALNAGDAAATAPIRAYLDADVTVSPPLLHDLYRLLDTDAPRYASGQVRITARGRAARAYARIYRQVPFMRHGVPGCGLFAVNAAGRARWGTFPQIISDDTFVRLHFAPGERVSAAASYDWPLVEGWENLVKVRRRQDVGVDEIATDYPALLANDDKPAFPTSEKLSMALRDPVGFAVYSGVALASRLTRGRASGWSRGR
ncbi:glycosyltransferase [Thalassococcus sp. BH17M4-6]|uniref:glycosyltransferase n=1 Tax=Thalassococcus sp. BH17M4-6 TaxID=3413148 RepID=UPI003BE52C94